MRPVCTVRKNLCIMRPSCLHCEQEPVSVSDLSALWKRTCALSDLAVCIVNKNLCIIRPVCTEKKNLCIIRPVCTVKKNPCVIDLAVCIVNENLFSRDCLLCKWCRDEEGQLQKEMGRFDGRHAASSVCCPPHQDSLHPPCLACGSL